MKNVFILQYMKYCVLTFMALAAFQSFAQPANDDPCNATPLTVGTSCSFVPATTVNATATTGVPAPGCASYGGPDVWFTVVVPASGTVKLDSQTGTITDGGMAVYSGNCTSMTLIECDDDDSQNGAMSFINLTGQTPGATLYVRFWKYSSGTGTFSICASEPTPPPPCGASPLAGDACSNATPICDINGYCGNTSSSYGVDSWSSLTNTFCGSIENNSFLSFVASSSTISFDVWVNSSTMGYGIQIFIFSANNCSGPVTQYGPCYNPGTVPQGNVNITATGLTPGNTYYIMIDGNSGDVCNYTFAANSGVSIPVSVNPASSTICEGGTVNLTASGGNGTFTWNASADLNTTSGANVTATPPAAGTYNYTVNSSTGNPLCPSSTTATATIVVNPCGCGVTATNSGPVCSGTTTVNLFATTVAGGTYSWTGPNGFTSTDQNPTGVPIPATPGSYTFEVTMTENGNICVSTTTVVVNALPTVSGGTNQSVCQGASVTLSGSGAQSYTWNNSVANGVSFIPSGTQTYTVTGTDANSCQNTAQVVVTVNALPTIGAGNDQTVCPGTPVILTGSGAQSYTWNNGVTNGVSFNAASTQTYTVTGTDANGCQNTDQVVVTVYTLPVVNAGTDQNVCAGGSVILNGSGAQSYTWNNGVTNGVSFTPLSTATYTVTGTDANGCQNTDQVVVTVNALPTINAGTDQSVCSGASATLTATGGQTYSWNNGVTNGVSFTPLSTTTYTVTGTDANGCQNTDQVVVTVNALPAINAGQDQNICIGASATLAASGGQTYSWNNGVTNGVSFIPGTTQTYTVTGTDANGCQNTDQVIVVVNQLPNVGAGPDQTICQGQSVTLSGTGAQSYTWNNGVTNGTAFVPAGTQVYTVTGTNAAGCQNTATVTVTVLDAPLASISADVTSGVPGLEVNFTNSSQDANTYDFSFGNGQTYQTTTVSDEPVTTYDHPGIYTVILTAGNGICEDTAHVTIVVAYAPMSITVPNIFTPNGDGNNDTFYLRLENGASLEVTIVNRWGNKMAAYSGVAGYWDGTVNGNLAEEGVYFFKYTATGMDGTTQTGQGDIQLIRD